MTRGVDHMHQRCVFTNEICESDSYTLAWIFESQNAIVSSKEKTINRIL